MNQAEAKRKRVREIVRSLYDVQDTRIRMGNRLKFKKDGSDQKDNGTDSDMDFNTIPVLVDTYSDYVEMESAIAKSLKAELKGIPVYDTFLKNVKGCGPLMAAVIIAEYDIHQATTVSKLWQFTGLNPGMVQGRKMVDGKPTKVADLVRGDRLTAGYLAPFNKKLRTKMVGVLGSCFLKSKSEYAKYYYDYKSRKAQSEMAIDGRDKDWNETSDKHRHSAAVRYMLKMFLRDLYVAWRTCEGLEVRKPYEEEYLGRKHGGQVA